MPARDMTDQAMRAVLMVRGLLDQGKSTKDAAAETGLAPSTVSNIKNGRRWKNPVIPIALLEPRLPQAGEKCEKCGREARVFTKENVCLECNIINLNRLNLLHIGQPQSKRLSTHEQE